MQSLTHLMPQLIHSSELRLMVLLDVPLPCLLGITCAGAGSSEFLRVVAIHCSLN
jgi:hypothetical protein